MYLAELSFLFFALFQRLLLVCSFSWYGICTKSYPLRTSFLMKLVLGQNKCIVEEAAA